MMHVRRMSWTARRASHGLRRRFPTGRSCTAVIGASGRCRLETVSQIVRGFQRGVVKRIMRKLTPSPVVDAIVLCLPLHGGHPLRLTVAVPDSVRF